MRGRFCGILLPTLMFVTTGVFLGCERNWGGPDTDSPTVIQAHWVDLTHVDVEFNEEVDQTSAHNQANYTIAEASDPSSVLSVVEATLQGDLKTVRLTTAEQKIQTAYTVTVTDVRDLAGNSLLGENIVEFTSGTAADGDFLTYESDIRPIFESKCTSCHGPGGMMASKPLTSYDEVMAFVNNGKLKVKAEAGHRTFDEESTGKVIAWINAGAPEN